MKPPCMIIAANILPALRVEVAQRLVNDYKMKPIEAAEKMDVTPAAVTQYLKGSRGKEDIAELLRESGIQALLSGLASKLAGDAPPGEVLEALCRLCEAIRSRGLLCPQCKSASQVKTLRGCTFCTG